MASMRLSIGVVFVVIINVIIIVIKVVKVVKVVIKVEAFIKDFLAT